MRPSDLDRTVQTHPERRRLYFSGATVRPHRRSERAHLGLVGGAGGDALRRWRREGELDGRGVILVVAGRGWGAPHRSRPVLVQASFRRARTRAPGHGKNGA
jgi:hypothetical protein